MADIIRDDPRYKQGYVRASETELTREWVPANAFSVRGIFPRGDAAKFSIDELDALVRDYLAERGVTLGHFDGFLFNYHPSADVRGLHEARDEADPVAV